MFFFRLNKIRIVNNRELIGRAEVRILSFITTDHNPLPELDGFFATNDPVAKRTILEAAVGGVLQANIFPEIQKIRDNHVLFFGDTGISLLTSETIPGNFNWQLVAIDNDQDIRENAALIESIIADEGFDGFVNNVGTLIGIAANPAFELGVQVAKFVAKTILKIAKAKKDDQIGILMMSLNRAEHYVHGHRNAENVPDISGNMFVDYTIFAG
jgi:hypothetical protein